MKKLADNTDLYNYLLSLADLLAGRGAVQLAESVLFAARHGSGLSTEFLGQARIALRRVLGEANLEVDERNELRSVIEQLEVALRR